MSSDWVKTGEDRLLHDYWDESGPGTLYCEVGIGGREEPWPDSSERRIDGVIVRAGAEHSVRKRRRFETDLAGDRVWNAVELIEAKVGLSEGVIGQAIAAKWMFEQQFGAAHEVTVARNTVLYRHEDAAMKWVADRLGLNAVQRDPPETNNPMKARPHYHLRDGDIERLAKYRRDAAGQIITRIPIGGPRSRVDAWADSTPTFVKYLRVVDGPVAGITVFESRESFLALAETAELELVVVQPDLTRGAIGVADAHALMLSEQYGVDIASRVVACGRADPALKAACEARHIHVKVVGAPSSSDDEAEER